MHLIKTFWFHLRSAKRTPIILSLIGILGVFTACLNNIALADTVSTTTTVLTNPIHYDDTWWTWPSQSGGYTSYSIDITPEADGSPDGYFFASAFYFYNGGTPYNPSGVGFGYLGLQTEEDSPINAKGDIFSIWGSEAASNAQYTTSFSEGQSGWSARNTYPWIVGHIYNLEVAYIATESDGEHWGAWVTDTSTNVKSEIGELVVPDSFGMLANSSTAFHERFSGSINSCADLHYSDVEFTNPMFNSNVEPTGHTNDQPIVTGCQSDYGVVDIPNGVRTVIGGLPPATSTVTTTTPVVSSPPTTKPSSTSPSVTINEPTASSPKLSTLDTSAKKPAAKSKIDYSDLLSYGGFVIILLALIVSGEMLVFKHKKHSPGSLRHLYTTRNLHK